jgi:hypothetical protein
LFIVSKLSLQKYTKISIFQSLTFCQYTNLFVSISEKQQVNTISKITSPPASIPPPREKRSLGTDEEHLTFFGVYQEKPLHLQSQKRLLIVNKV